MILLRKLFAKDTSDVVTMFLLFHEVLHIYKLLHVQQVQLPPGGPRHLLTSFYIEVFLHRPVATAALLEL